MNSALDELEVVSVVEEAGEQEEEEHGMTPRVESSLWSSMARLDGRMMSSSCVSIV